MIIEKENYKLYNEDCLEAMDKLIKKDIQVDLVVTSPLTTMQKNILIGISMKIIYHF